MTVTIEKLDNNQVKLNIEVDSSVSSFEYEKACKKIAKRVNVPGFRQGKAPKNILEKYNAQILDATNFANDIFETQKKKRMTVGL